MGSVASLQILAHVLLPLSGVLYEFQPMELSAMEQQAIIKTIIKTLDNYY
ncbi:hypothetical protein PH505_ag00870 [Pseudoalteromonas distincta]|nr:hypothetical protein PH505_ag00870 [Pseudoalteromonas distincta]